MIVTKNHEPMNPIRLEAVRSEKLTRSSWIIYLLTHHNTHPCVGFLQTKNPSFSHRVFIMYRSATHDFFSAILGCFYQPEMPRPKGSAPYCPSYPASCLGQPKLLPSGKQT